jgi:hypothetical protein
VNDGSGALLVVVVEGDVGVLVVFGGAGAELVVVVLGVLAVAPGVGALATVTVLACDPQPASRTSDSGAS